MNTNRRIKRELDNYRLKYDLYEKDLCSQKESDEYKDLLKQGKSLPDDIYHDDDWRNACDSEFFRLVRSDLTQEDIMEYLTYKKLDMLKTIKNCIVFFTVLAVIALILSYLVAAF